MGTLHNDSALKQLPQGPFALWRMPGDTSWHLSADVDAEGCALNAGQLRIAAWPGSKPMPYAVCTESTDKEQYCRAVRMASQSALKRKGKTVIVRQICGTFRHFDPTALANEYFDGFERMFCFIFYHPLSGWWMGASPELLVEYRPDGKLASRALAGTRPAGIAMPWDVKNIEEHNMVTADIIERINTLGDDWAAHAEARTTLPYGAIEHLCTPVTISPSGSNALAKAASALHPTPAVGGLPRNEAMADISRLETAPRLFYGGTACTPDKAYVILRCVHFDSEHWCVYSGSGITPLSDPLDEWAETEAKAKPLVNILKKYSLSQ